MNPAARTLFFIAAVVLFLIALVIEVGWVNASDPSTVPALFAGGAAAFAAGHI